MLKDPKPPMTPGTITEDVSKNLHQEMYLITMLESIPVVKGYIILFSTMDPHHLTIKF